MNKAYFRYYGELNQLISPSKRQISFEDSFFGGPGIKDRIEVHGVPHPLVFMILVNGERVDFSYKVAPFDYVSVFPPFRSLPVPKNEGVNPLYQGEKRFFLDDHLGRLARYKKLPRKPRPLAAGMNWQNKFKNHFTNLNIVSII